MKILKNPLLYYCVNGMYYMGMSFPDISLEQDKDEKNKLKSCTIQKYTIFPIAISLYILMLITQLADFLLHLNSLTNMTYNGIVTFFFLDRICPSVASYKAFKTGLLFKVSITKFRIIRSNGCQYLFNEIYEKTTYENQLDPNELEIIKNGVADANKANRYQWFLYTMAFSSASIPNILKMLLTGEVNLPMKIWLPFDPKEHFQLSMTIEIVFALPSTVIAGLLEALVLNLIIHAIIQLRLIQYKFREALSERTYEESKMYVKLYKCIQLHQDVSRYIEVLNDLISPIMLLVFLFYMVLFCVTGFQLLLTDLFTIDFAWISVFLMSKILELFILYYYGAKLHFESLKVADQVWETDWYIFPAQHNKKLRSIIMFIMLRAQRPLQIKVGSFFPMSMAAYTSAIRTAYSLLTFLRNFV